MPYIPTSQSEHGRDEELQWARLVGTPGVALIFIQKLCTAFHELEPAWRHEMLSPASLPHFRERLLGRARRLLQVLEVNDLDQIDGVDQLKSLLQRIADAQTLEALVLLAEPIHAVNHRLTDGLERMG